MSNQQTVIMVPAKAVRQDLKTETNTIVYMPLATTENPGVVKIGNGLNIDADGVLSFDQNEITILQIAKNGVVIPPDENKIVNIVLNKTDVNLENVDNTSDADKPVSVLQQIALNTKQDKRDVTLITTNKTIVGGINEVVNNLKNYATIKYVDDLYAKLSIGGNISLVFDTEYEFLTWLEGTFIREDDISPNDLKIGDVILLKEENVPDYWCSSISVPMTINDFTSYEVKINLDDYVKLTQLTEISDRVTSLETTVTDITPDVMRALKTPISAPATTKLVAVDTANSQEMLSIGDGLVIENGVLKSTGSGDSGGSGNTTVYIADTAVEELRFDSDPQTQITSKVSQENFDNLVSNNVVINSRSNGSLYVGTTAPTSDTGNNIAIGKNAKAKSGSGRVIALGGNSSGAGASITIGQYATTTQPYGIAIGTGEGSTEGLIAKTAARNAIQLGQGTNSISNSFQLYGDNIYNWGTHTLTVQNIELNGQNIATTFDDKYLPLVGGTLTGGLSVNGNLTVVGDITQQGSSYVSHAEQLYSTKDYIYLREGNTGALAEGAYTGFEFIKYDGTNNGRLVVDNKGIARVGDVGEEQPLATREETPTDGGFAKWDAATNKFITTTDVVQYSETVDTTSAINPLDGKANKDLSNVTYPQIVADGVAKTGAGDRVIESYVSSDSKIWYRKWASGWKECGGRFVSTSKINGLEAVDYEITFPISFSSTNYNVQTTTSFAASHGGHVLWYTRETNKSKDVLQITAFNVTSNATPANATVCYWKCCGY